jgi:hypothetical protein
MPLPVAVPRCSWKRSIAAMTSSRLVVGACTTAAVPAKDTTPTFTSRGRFLTKALAASCAATSRFGLTSSARMLPETSIARMMVRCDSGSVITAMGRATASSSVPRPAAAAAAARGGASPGPCPAPALATARLARRTVLRRRRAAATSRPAPAAAAATASHSRVGQMKVMPGSCNLRLGVATQVRRKAPAAFSRPRWRRRSAKRSSASSRSSSVASSSVSAPACAPAPRAARLALLGLGGVALAEARVGGVDEQLLAGFGVFHGHQADVGQRHLQRVEQAHRHHLVALRQPRQRTLPAGLR